MIPVVDARQRILDALTPLPPETVSLTAATGRVLAESPAARVTQPPADMSAMDGYAARSDDLKTLPATLTVVGEVPAGQAFAGTLAPGQCVRIFTGGPVPAGADTIVVQEDTEREGATVTVKDCPPPGKYIRRKGMDFAVGDTPLAPGRRLEARTIGLAAAMNHPWLSVARRPRVAILATGDEIVLPGQPVGPQQIVSANAFTLASVIEAAGGVAIDLGIARDDRDHLARLAEGARGADLLVTTGGASVGDRDLVRSVLGDDGQALDFWRIAMRPGKPLMFGRTGGTPHLGLPGNPVSAYVCALLFLRPALWRLQGLDRRVEDSLVARPLAAPLPANDLREDYVRARLDDPPGSVTPLPVQDSSQMATLAAATGLIVRPPHQPALAAGTEVPVLPLDD